MTTSQSDKAARFRALHQGAGAFVIPNPWDAGSARILAGLGFQALATSSGASAGILGRRDGKVTRDEALAQCARHRRGDRPARRPPIWRRASATRRRWPRRRSASPPRSASSAARSRTRPATRTSRSTTSARPPSAWRRRPRRRARCRSRSRSPRARRTSCAATRTSTTPSSACRRSRRPAPTCCSRPGLPDLAAVRAVCAAVSKPVNFMVGIRGKSFTVAELEAAGVKRISLATSLYRAAMSGLRRRRPRGEGQGHLRLRRPLHGDARAERLHAAMTRW